MTLDPSPRARILFLCTGNRARSQLAEGLTRGLVAAGVEVASAGSRPNPRGVHPRVVELLRERGIDATAFRPKHLDELEGAFDWVITLCDDAARECPTYPARRGRLHWGLPDPDRAGGDPEKERQVFRDLRDDLERRLLAWLASERLLGS